MQRSLFLLVLILSLALFLLKDVSLSYSPDTSQRIISVKTELKGSFQEGIEEIITNPLEDELNLLEGISSIRSVSEDEQSMITIRFEDRIDLAQAYLEVREVVERVSALFPKQTQKPTILKNKSDASPVFLLMIEDKGIHDEESLKKIFQGVPGAGQVDVSGAPAKDVILNSSTEKLAGYGFSDNSLAGALAAANRIVSVSIMPGYPLTGDFRSASLDELGSRLLSPGLKLKDIAEPQWKDAPTDSLSKVNGKETVLVRIRKAGDANTILLCRELRAKASGISSSKILYDKGKTIEDALTNTITAIAVGILCVFLLTGLFLGSWKNALILSINIPFSVLCAMALLNLGGKEIDMMVLAGTAVGIGLLVDGGVIVLEAGYKESRKAVFYSLISTIVAFSSLLFAPIEIKEKYLGMIFSVSCVLIFSIIYIFIIMPGLLRETDQNHESFKMADLMERVLKQLHRFRYLSLILVFLVTILNFYLALKLPVRQNLLLDDNSLGFSVEYPSGTTRDSVKTDLESMEQALNSANNIDYYSSEYKSEKGSFFIQLKDETDNEEELRNYIDEHSSGLKGTLFFYEEPDSIAYDITLTGYNRETLYSSAAAISDQLKYLTMTTGVTMHFKQQQPFLNLNPDPLKVSRYRMTPASVLQRISSLLNRPVRLKWLPPHEIWSGQHSYDIRITDPEQKYHDKNRLADILLYTDGATGIPLKQLTRFIEIQNYGRIYHYDGVRGISLSVDLPMNKLKQGEKEILTLIEKLELPQDIRINSGEILRERRKLTHALLLCTCVSLILIFFFLIFIFESIRLPVFLFAQLPFSLMLPMPVLYLLGIPLSAPVFFGLILVIGVSVNNGIVLFSETGTKDLSLSGITQLFKKHAIALFVAFITTIASVIPLLFSDKSGGAFLTGLSITVCMGLIGSLISLILLSPLISGSWRPPPEN